MGYSGVFVFGDSLVDSGNALKLAEAYDDYFPFTSLPDGAPTSEKGYYSGNFTNGWTFADLISNKYLGVTTKTVFPFGFIDPLGVISDPNGNNLNFAYGGAQIRKGDEAVPDMDDQTDAYRDAVDGDADPNALHMFVFGANDLHDLVPRSGAWATLAEAQSDLQRAANEYIEEVQQTIEIGAGHILLIGVPDIGIQPDYNGTADEAARRAAATQYAEMLDGMIRAQLDQLTTPGVDITYVPFAELANFVLGTMVDLYGETEIFPLNLSNEVFFDRVHPTTQVHAIAAAYLTDLLSETPAGQTMPLTAPDFSAGGNITLQGEVDTITISLAANTSYTFELLGLSTLGGNVSVLADPILAVFGPAGTLVGTNDDGGVGLDACYTFTSGPAGDYTIQLCGVGMMTGSYQFQAAGQATGNNSYAVSHAGAIILEHAGGGFDTVRARVSYALNAGAEVEMLRTSNDRGTTAINLTGNEFAQTIVGNRGSNVIEGKAGADVLTGGAGKDVFVLGMAAVTNPGAANIDRITDYGSGDVVDLGQILSVGAGTNVIGGQYVRVTTSGLVQVDLDGGGNNWVTLSSINGAGAVTIRYLSGGVATNLAVSRVAESTASALAATDGTAAHGFAAWQDSHDSLTDAMMLHWDTPGLI
jgi:phospholipase/lecithinase/hemolysin